MFEQVRGRHDAKRNIFTVDASTGLALSPYAVHVIDRVRRRKQRLTTAINGKKTQELESRLAESLSSIRTVVYRSDDDPVSRGFSMFMLDQKKSEIINCYVALFHSYMKYAGLYRRYVEKLESRLFAYYSAASLYVRIDPKVNSDLARLAPDLREPPVLPGLQELYDRIPEDLRETLPAITD